MQWKMKVKKTKMEVRDILICECSSAEHQLLVQYFEDENEVYVQTHLAKKTFWERLKYGIKYILGYQSRYGAFDEIILGPQHIKNLQSIINHIRDIELKKSQTSLFKD